MFPVFRATQKGIVDYFGSKKKLLLTYFFLLSLFDTKNVSSIVTNLAYDYAGKNTELNQGWRTTIAQYTREIILTLIYWRKRNIK